MQGVWILEGKHVPEGKLLDRGQNIRSRGLVTLLEDPLQLTQNHIADEARLPLLRSLLDQAFRKGRLLRIVLGDQTDEDVRI